MNLAGNSNQQPRPNIFGDNLQYPSASLEWNRFSLSYCSQPNFPFCSNYGPAPVTFPLHPSANPNGTIGYMGNTYGQVTLPTSSQYRFEEWRPSNFTRCKRKTESPPPTPYKQHITEEKMAEHLSKLHISSETAINDEAQDIREKRLYLCDEMRKLQTDSILPAQLLDKITRPCTALVLWQPPQRLVPEEVVDNNNEEEVPDNNLMDTR